MPGAVDRARRVQGGTGLQVNLRADGLHSVVSELGRHMVKEGVRELYV